MPHLLDEKSKKTFCPLAWNHSFVNQDGSFQVCCTSEEYPNHIRDENGEIIFITDGKTPQEIMNTEFMKKLRLQMLNGEWPDLCKRCLLTEKMSGFSRRNVEVVNYQDDIEQMLEATAPDGSTTYEVTSADYRLGNLCNLQCRMCNPRSTKLWIKEWNDIKPLGEQFSKDVMDSYSKYDWIDSEALLMDFKHKAPSLSHIHFAGGEPLLVPQMSKILERCIDSGNAKNIVITYNTNLTILPKKVLELWKEFKGVKILASVDAIGDLNHYIRFPTNWEKVNNNLEFIDRHHEEYNIKECLLSTTVQALNILHLEEIYSYLAKFTFIVKAPNLINLYFPHYFQTSVLPPALKKAAILKLRGTADRIRPDLPSHYHYLLDNIHSVLAFMSSRDRYSEGNFETFKKFQRDYDSLKNLKLTDYCPEFIPFIG